MSTKRRIVLGWYDLGARKVHVTYVPHLSGGEFWAHRIDIGGASGEWYRVVAIAAHEALEHVTDDMALRYVPAFDAARASDGYFFACDHAKFSEAVARMAHFLAKVLPDLSRAFREAKKRDKRKRRKRG